MGSTNMIAIYVSPIMVPIPLNPNLPQSACSHLAPQLLSHKDSHIFPRFEDHQRYAVVVATTSILLLLYGS
jgi:hypothetical protein